MNNLVKYLVYGIIIFFVLSAVYFFVTKERIYYTTEEGIAKIHSNKWGDKTMDFYFQYPAYVMNHFTEIQGASSDTAINFEDSSYFTGSASTDKESVSISGTYTQPTGAEWKYNIMKLLYLGGLVGVSGTAELKMNFTMNNKRYTAYVTWSVPSVASVFIQEEGKEKIQLTTHHFGAYW